MAKMVPGNGLATLEQAVEGELMNLIDTVDKKRRAAEEALSEEERLRNAASAILEQLGGLMVQDDNLIFEGEKFVLPAQYKGDVDAAIKYLVDHQKQERQPFNHSHAFSYRPYDGAYAFMNVMKKITGTTGFGVTKFTFFGPVLPEFRSIKIGPKKSTQVPWGTVAFPMYEAEFELGARHDGDESYVFFLSVTAPRKWRKHIEAIFQIIERELETNSIYRGKAINGHGLEPEFLDLSRVDPEEVVYSTDVAKQLLANVWSPIRYSQAHRDQNIPLKRAVVFAGPYGTGKSLGAMLTAKEAVDNGWTFILCRTGEDNPLTVLETAKYYAPAVVVIEDIDVHAGTNTKVEISKLLDRLDGITNKGNEVIAVFTTNHLEEIQKGALRPGRIDAVIEIEGLDKDGFIKLVTRRLGDKWLADDIDWDVVSEAFHGFLPAFVSEAAQRSQRFAMATNEGQPSIISTEDLVAAANSLRPQLEQHNGGKEGVNGDSLTDAVRGVVENVMKRTSWDDAYFTVDEATILNGGRQ